MAFILAIFSTYWGVFKVERKLNHLFVYVVDMDGAALFDNTGNAPFVGPAITQLVEKQLVSDFLTLEWSTPPGSHINNDVLEVRQATYNWDAWAAIIINSQCSALDLSTCTLASQQYRFDSFISDTAHSSSSSHLHHVLDLTIIAFSAFPSASQLI